MKIVAKYSPENFHELTTTLINPHLRHLEEFFINWKNRAAQKSFSFIIINRYYDYLGDENMKVIEKYKLVIIKRFLKALKYDNE